MTFSKAELERYSRHLILPEFNIRGQECLKRSGVLVVGSGGLGTPLLQYLAAAGVGRIGIVDFDVVSESNLQRQVLFGVPDVGELKVEVAREKLQNLNPHIEIVTYPEKLTSENALDIIDGYDLVADGTDNFPTRYLVNDACVLLDKPNVYAAIFRFEGQVSVFNYMNSEGERGPNYRDLFPDPPPPGAVPSCAEGGVLGVLPGIIGSMQANEVIKVLAGIGEPLSGKLFIFDTLKFETRILEFDRDPDNPINGDNPRITSLIDYDEFCGINPIPNDMKEITVQELKLKMDQQDEFQLIDVREKYEYDIVNIGAELIPMKNILHEKERIETNKPVIIHCRSGGRSAQVILALEEEFQYDNLYNLKGGVLAWAREIDPSLPTY